MTAAPANPARRSASVEIDADRLREMRQDRGLSQVDLAAKIGVASAYLSQLETGARTRVSPAVYLRLCEAFDVNPTKSRTLRKAA